jgi:hypothetical protein
MAKKENIFVRAAKFTFVTVPKTGVKAGNAVRKGWTKK